MNIRLLQQEACQHTPFSSSFNLEIRTEKADECIAWLPPHPKWLEKGTHHYSAAALLAIMDHLGVMPYMGSDRKAMATLSYSAQIGQLPSLEHAVIIKARLNAVKQTIRHTQVIAYSADAKSNMAIALNGGLTYLMGALPGTTVDATESIMQKRLGEQNLEPPFADVADPVQASSFAEWLGLTDDFDIDNGYFEVPYSDHLLGSTTPPALHGGAGTALLVQAATMVAGRMGYAMLANTHLDFMRSGKQENMKIRFQVVNRSRRKLVMDMELWQQNESRLLLKCQSCHVKSQS